MKFLPLIGFFILITSCQNSAEKQSKTAENSTTNDASSKREEPKKDSLTLVGSANFLTGYPPTLANGDINVVVEIPAGTIDKWEVNKADGSIKWEIREGKPRVVKYIGYPGNYGMIPQTLLPKELGGDGDPLDVLVLGAPVARGSVIPCKIIGVLNLLDRGEQDDKLIAVSANSPLYHINNIAELKSNYNGIMEIVELWFSNYKGPNKMESQGFSDKETANKILQASIIAYQKAHP